MLECGTAVNLSVNSTLTVSSNSQPNNYVHHTPIFIPCRTSYLSSPSQQSLLFCSECRRHRATARSHIYHTRYRSRYSLMYFCLEPQQLYILLMMNRQFHHVLKTHEVALVHAACHPQDPLSYFLVFAIRSFLPHLPRSPQGESDFSFTRRQTN
jgi:hypothetical protein